MTITGEPGPSPGAVDPTRWLARLASVTATDLAAALDEIAERVHEVFPVDVVSVMVVDDLEHEGITRGYCVGPSAAAQAIAPLLTSDGIDPVGVGEAAFEAGRPVVWPHLVSEPSELARLARLADAGGPAGALHRLMLDAGGLAVPLSAPHAPALGAVSLVSLSRENPLPRRAVEQLQALAPQLALTVRNHQLAARNRRNRHTLEGVISSSPMGVLVSDVQGRLSIANAAAGEILAIDLASRVGQPLRAVVDEHIKWRFVNPDEYAARLHRMVSQGPGRATLEAETVEGRAIEHSSSPVRDSSGQTVGRVIMLHDVTAARTALAEARRLAEERAALLEREERRAHEEAALSRAAHTMALTLTAADIHERLLEESMRLLPACEKVAVLTVDRRGRGDAGGHARLRREHGVAHDLAQRRGGGGPRDGRRPALHLQRHPGGRAHLQPDHPGRGDPLVHARPPDARGAGVRPGERQQQPAAGLRRARAAPDLGAGAPRPGSAAERAALRAGAPHRRDPAAGAAGRRAAARAGARAGRAVPAGRRLPGGRRLLQRLAPARRAGSPCWWATCPARASRRRA